jgi:hypothetical protein
MAGAPHDKSLIPWEEYRYVAYAQKFGWTPAQVDDLPLHLEPWIFPVMNAIEADIARKDAAAQEAAQKAAEKKPGRNG